MKTTQKKKYTLLLLLHQSIHCIKTVKRARKKDKKGQAYIHTHTHTHTHAHTYTHLRRSTEVVFHSLL